MIPHAHAPLRWFDDVAQAVVNGPEFIIFAVCANAEECSGLTDWLSCVLPGMTGCVVAVPPCESITKSVVVSPLEHMLSVHSASHWNRCGDRLTRSLRDDHLCKSLVIVSTDEQMSTFAKAAPDLISISAFMRVQPDLPALEPGNPLVPAYQAELKKYEEAYGLSTPEFMRHLFELKDLPEALTESEIKVWQNLAQILRNIDRQP